MLLFIISAIPSNISSSDRSSPMQRTKSACLLFSVSIDRIFSATNPLLTPCHSTEAYYELRKHASKWLLADEEIIFQT
jgi:hypothetical protein